MRKSLRRALLLVLTGCILLIYASIDARKKEPVAPGSSPATAILVVTAPVISQPIPRQAQALGTLKALQSVVISSEVSGRVSQIFFGDGQQVAKGMPIIQLNDEEDRANYDAAVTALNLAKVKYQRAQLLFNEGGISRQDVDQLRADVESKDSAVKSAQATLNQKELTAPFNGVLTAFQVQVGDYVNQGQPLVSLVNRDQLKVVYSLSEQYLSSLKLGQSVTVESNAYPGQTFQGAVTYVAPSADETTRSIGIQAIIDNKKNVLSPGLFVHVTQTLGVDNNALVIPEEAVMASVQGYTVYKIVNGQAHLTPVQLGVRVDGKVRVTQGLALNDQVVSAGQQKLQDGSYVTAQSE